MHSINGDHYIQFRASAILFSWSSKSPEKSVLHCVGVHFFFLFPLFVETESSPFWLCSRTHSLCSCSNSSFVSSPSRNNLELSEESVGLSSFLWLWAFSARPLLSGSVFESESLTEAVVSAAADWFSVARISRVMLRTPTWMIPSSSFWISRMRLASGNMSMKR